MKWSYLLLAYLSLIGLGLADNIRGPVYPELLSHFALSNSAGSFFFSIASMSAMFNNLLTHYWLPRLGVMGTLRLYSLLLVGACLMLGFASQITTVWVGAALLGISFGGLAVSQNLLAVHGSTLKRRTQAVGGLHTMYALASLLAPILVSISYLFFWPWNSMFKLAAVVPFIVFVWSFREKISPQLHFENINQVDAKPIRRWPLMWVGLFTTLYVMTEILISSRVVLYARSVSAYAPKQANDLLSGFFIGMLAGRLFLTVVHVRVKNVTLLYLSLSASLLTMLLAIFVNPFWFAVTGLAMSLSFPCMISHASEVFGRHTPRAMAWIFTGNYVGLMIMHYGVGVIADTYGLQQALLLGPIFLGAALVLLARQPKFPR